MSYGTVTWEEYAHHAVSVVFELYVIGYRRRRWNREGWAEKTSLSLTLQKSSYFSRIEETKSERKTAMSPSGDKGLECGF